MKQQRDSLGDAGDTGPPDSIEGAVRATVRSAAAPPAPAANRPDPPPAQAAPASDGAKATARRPKAGLGAALRPCLAPLPGLRLLPLPLLALAALVGGWAVGVALAAVILAVVVQEAPDAAVDETGDTPHLAAALVAGAAPVLLIVLHGLDGGTALGVWGWFGLLLATALWLGQVGLAAGHALIHAGRGKARLGLAFYALVWAGPLASAHRLVHHRAAATADDPFTADPDEGFWGYLGRAWPDAIVAGWEIEAETGRDGPGATGPHPGLILVAGSAAASLAIAFLAGAGALVLHLVISALVHVQMLLCEFTRHHGRQRRRRGAGEVEPYGPTHEWSAPDPLARLCRGRPRRPGDHAAHDDAPPAPGVSPRLPLPFPMMSALALVPPLWRRALAARTIRADRPRRGPGGRP